FVAQDAAGLLERFDREMAELRRAAQGVADERMGESWTLARGDEILFTLPRAVALRSWVLNHLVHHRGQLSVYLRLLDVPVPSIYGPSADEEAPGRG
ncbi:MAG TPA: DinB family protein, partial [Thermoanaerobaculia bacterium]|nr:DinB family protein [Thermoanaerobaculia bacterium]